MAVIGLRVRFADESRHTLLIKMDANGCSLCYSSDNDRNTLTFPLLSDFVGQGGVEREREGGGLCDAVHGAVEKSRSSGVEA